MSHQPKRPGLGINSIKADVRKRDGFCCTSCGMTNNEHLAQYGKQLDVHRVKPGQPYTLAGCVTLCRSCHGSRPKRQPGERNLAYPGRRLVSFSAPDEFADHLTRVAHTLGMDLANFIRLVLSSHLSEYEKRAAGIHEARTKRPPPS